MVSEAAFNAALEAVPEQNRTSQPHWLSYLEGASAIANDAWTPGIVAEMSYPEELSGRYWIVASDPGIDATQNFMITTKYRLAIIDLNIPKQQWYGAMARAAKRVSPSLGTGRCLGDESVCVAPGGLGPCGQARCAGEGGSTTYLAPTQVALWQGKLVAAGHPIVPTLMFESGRPLPSTFCLAPRLGACTHTTFGPTIEVDTRTRFEGSIPTNTCTGQTVEHPFSGRVPPEFCTYANFSGMFWSPSGAVTAPGLAPADCEGRCFGCESANGAVDSNGRPRSCNLQRPLSGGGLCQATDAVRQMQQLEMKARFLATNGQSRCEPAQMNGLRNCVVCENDTCRETVEVDSVSPSQTIVLPCVPYDTLCRQLGKVTAPGTENLSMSKSPAVGQPSGGRPASNRGTVGNTTIGRPADTVNAQGPTIPSNSTPEPDKDPADKGGVEDAEVADSNSEKPMKLASEAPLANADPVTMMAGSLEVSHTDLSFAGPVRPLEFIRSYSSQGHNRSELGSNWSHNWDVRIIALRHENLPDGVDPYCAGTPAEVTCVMLRAGNSAKLFMRDIRDGLFKPQAGAFSTIMKTADGWYLRSPDFHVQRFDLDGLLTYDADRFGNAFKIEYEFNAWGALDRAVCPDAVLRLNPMPGSWTDAQGPVYAASSLQCTLLAGLVGRTKPMVKSAEPLTLNLPATPPDGLTLAQLNDAKALLLAVQTGGTGNASAWGQRKKRVKRVFEVNDTGNAGRSLDFTYWPDSDTVKLPSSGTRRAGLLQRVTGPAGARLEFSYVAPALPVRLNEALLSQVVRSDTNGTQPAGVVAGPQRTYAFTYASAAVPGTTMTANQLTDLRRRFSEYFASAFSCSYVRHDPCGNPVVPAFMAMDGEEVERRVDAFLSDEADNILTITAPSETVETRYETNPLSLSFDKVKAQRWGSSSVTGSASLSPNWTTQLPEATMSYADEGPDGTDPFLDPAIASRYGYEMVVSGTHQDAEKKFLLLEPNSTAPLNIPPAHFMTHGTVAAGRDGGSISPCDVSQEPLKRTALPGYRKSYGYYDIGNPTSPTPPAWMTDGLVTPGVDLNMALMRSKLSCAQLAEAQTWDARHNDLQTVYTGRNPNGPGFMRASFSGRRPEMNRNANRICAWTKFNDRDGVQHVYGFNYHGRPLVDAVRVAGSWRFAETLYNADGNVISQRRVMSQGTPWTTDEGDTRYGYVEGQIVGPNFQEPSPWYWSQRGNVITVLERARKANGVVTVAEEVEGALTAETTVGRYTQFFYEPLFSQVAKVIVGDVATGGVRRAQRSTDFYYDYQECAPAGCLLPLLQDAQKWGAQYPTNSAGALVTTGNPLSVGIDYGDLNGDGRNDGFPLRGTVARIVTTAMRPGSSSTETSFYRFSPHGKPYFIQAPDGAITTLEYLPFGALTGPAQGNQRGYLGRVRMVRNRDLSASYGPPVTPCAQLPGPYQWLLPASCSNTSSLSGQLETVAGLSSALAAEIAREAFASSADFAATTSFQYSELGAASKVLRADGSEVRITRDVDARVREEALYENASQLHSRTVITRNTQGKPTRTQRFNRTGGDLGSVLQSWDEEGNLRFHCAEAAPGGCVTGGHGSLPTNGTSTTYWYSKEGRLNSEMDAEGAYTTYTRDERGWVTHVRRQAAGEGDRLTAFSWSNDGNLLARLEGPVGFPIRSESRTYDGYDRVTSVTDTQGRVTQVKHSARDVVSSVRTQGSSWVVNYVRDDFARVTEQWTNGQRTLQLWRKPGGRVWKKQPLGAEPTYVTYDDFGSAAFVQQGTVKTVRVAPADLRFAGSARVRNESQLKTSNLEQTLSVLGDPLSELEIGYDGTATPPSRSSTFTRDDNGFMSFTTDALGATSEYVRDFLGRPTTVRVPVNPGVMKTTAYQYNKRGQLLRMSDPRGSGTSFGETVATYSGYGEPKTRTVPGGTAGAPSDVVATWSYDAVGRLTQETMGPATLGYQYQNDRVWRIVGNTSDTILRQFAYDGLGRLETATHFNRGLFGLVADSERTVQTTFGYDGLGRQVSEVSRVGTRSARVTNSTWVGTSSWRRNTSRPDGTSQVETYDSMGRLETMTRPWNARTSQWKYEGELGSEEYHDTAGAQYRRALSYDGLSQLMGSGYSAGGAVYSSDLLRDKAGRVVSANRTFTSQSIDKAWRGHKYQQGGALESVFEAVGLVSTGGLDPANTTSAQVDALGLSAAAAQYNYSRDVEGSVLSVDRVDVAGQTPRFKSPARKRGYQMEDYELDGTGTGSMLHDGAGRVTREFGRTYTYDDFHSLVRAGATSGSNAQGFQYDGVGRLIAVRRGTAGWPVEEEVAYDGTQMVAAWNGAQVGTWSATWGQGVDNLVSLKPAPGAGEVMAVKDGRGSVVGYYRGETPTQGLWVTADYTPEGRATQRDWVAGTSCTESGTTQCPRLGGLPFGFHGAYKSPAHGLLYFRNRWYSVEAGQWLTHDPLGEVDSVNLYAFNRFDSVNFVDPFGLESGKSAAGSDNAEDPKNRGPRSDSAFCVDHGPGGTNTECWNRPIPFMDTVQKRELKAEQALVRHETPPPRPPAAPEEVAEKARKFAGAMANFALGASTGVIQALIPGAPLVPLRPGNKAFDAGKNIALLLAGTYMMAAAAAGTIGGGGATATVPIVGQVVGPGAVAVSVAVGTQGTAAAVQGMQGLATLMQGNQDSGDGESIKADDGTEPPQNPVESVPTDSLNPTHGRTNTKAQMNNLRADIQANGIQEPIKYVEHNGQRFVVDGHHRLEIAKESAAKTVPAQKVDLPYKGYRNAGDLSYTP